MFNETNGYPSLRQWKKFVNQFCPRCYQTGRHKFLNGMGSRPTKRKGLKGTVYFARYVCLTEDCNQVVEQEEFIAHPMQTMDMFRDLLNGD